MSFTDLVGDELARARAEHGPMASAHEAYAVILEELEEFRAEVFRKQAARDKGRMRDELVQLAAMCQRAAEDLGLVPLVNDDEPVDLSWRGPWSVRARKILERLGVETVRDLRQISEIQLLSQRGCGVVTVDEIRHRMGGMGIVLPPDVSARTDQTPEPR